MKKIIVLILALALALCMLASCKKACEAHVDSDSNGLCDVCEAQMPACEHKDENRDFVCDTCGEELPNHGLILSESVIHQLSSAKTMKLDFKLNTLTDDNDWYMEEDTETSVPYYYENAVEGTIIFSFDTDGGLCARLEATSSSRYEAEGELDTTDTVIYLVDGSVYTYDEELDVYARRELGGVDVAAITSTLEALTEGVTIDEAKKNELLTEIGELAIKSFNIIENKGSVSIDLKDEVNSLLGYLAALDLENDTVRGVLGDALALVSEELTVEALETEVFRILGLTVNEALAEIDAWLTKEHGTTLQGLYDSIIADPTVAQIIKNAIKLQIPEGEVDDVDAEVEKVFNEQFKSFKLAEVIEAEGLGEVPLYDLILAMTGAAGEDAPTLEQMKEQVGAILDMTLSEFETNMGTPVFSGLKNIGESTKINALDARIDIGFKGLFNIDTVEGVFNVSIENKSPSEIEGKYNVSKESMSFSFKLHGISEETTAIVVPTDKDIYFDYYNSYFHSDYGSLSTYLDDGVLYLNLTICADRTIEVYAELADLSVLKSTTVTIPGDALEFYCDGLLLEHDETASLVIEINLAGNTFYVIQCPEYVVSPIPVTTVLDEIGYGEGVDNSYEYDLAPDFGGYLTYLIDSKGFIVLDDGYYISGLEFEYVTDEETGNMICTIIGVCANYPNCMKHADMTGFYGTTYDAADLEAYYGDDLTFTISLTEDGLVVSEGIRDIPEEYRDTE